MTVSSFAVFFFSFEFYGQLYLQLILGTKIELNATKEMIENDIQPGFEPGSPDCCLDALTTQPQNQPCWQHHRL